MLQQVRNWHFNKALTSMDCHWPHALNWRIMNLQSHASVLISRSECHFIMVCSCLRFWLQHSSRASPSSDATEPASRRGNGFVSATLLVSLRDTFPCTSSKMLRATQESSKCVWMCELFAPKWKTINSVCWWELTSHRSSVNRVNRQFWRCLNKSATMWKVLVAHKVQESLFWMKLKLKFVGEKEVVSIFETPEWFCRLTTKKNT